MTETFNATRADDALNPYGPRFYYLHRENILRQLAELREQRGVINPGHINRFKLLAVDAGNGEKRNQLCVFQGRDTCLDQEKSLR